MNVKMIKSRQLHSLLLLTRRNLSQKIKNIRLERDIRVADLRGAQRKVYSRARLDDILKRRFFFDLSSNIYGGVSGLYDYGPTGVEIMENIISEWKKHFIIEDCLLKMRTSQLTLEPVLKASGHMDRFSDLMVKDMKTGDCYRLDHLIKAQLEKISASKSCAADKKKEIAKILTQLDGYNQGQMSDIVKRFDMKAPLTGNDLTEPMEFNMMFSTLIAPAGNIRAFLRPEIAQGIFVNFKRLLEFNHGVVPFGVAQIGKSFRNEISPRGGIVRMREFTMAEIEYFVDPLDKNHAKFHTIKDVHLNLYSACNQVNNEQYQHMSMEEAVGKGIVANEVLAYYLARIHLFMTKIGIDPNKMRFRQHMSNEMAHYATDCWDCECLTSSGWLECIGCADRSCYDLTQHAKATNTTLTATRVSRETNKLEEFTPNVIEPSFGIDRIVYCTLEHCFRIREDNRLKTYFVFPAIVAPYKCSILPLSNKEELKSLVDKISASLTAKGLVAKIDTSGASIGKRYARTDEIGVPFGITIDFDTLQDNAVTLRFCITTEQIRVGVDEVAALVSDLSIGKIQWSEVKKLWPEFRCKDV